MEEEIKKLQEEVIRLRSEIKNTMQNFEFAQSNGKNLESIVSYIYYLQEKIEDAKLLGINFERYKHRFNKFYKPPFHLIHEDIFTEEYVILDDEYEDVEFISQSKQQKDVKECEKDVLKTINYLLKKLRSIFYVNGYDDLHIIKMLNQSIDECIFEMNNI